MEIAIETIREFQFDGDRAGYIRMEIQSVTNDIVSEIYTLNILDSAFKIETVQVRKDNPASEDDIFETSTARFNIASKLRTISKSYKDLDGLAKLLNLKRENFKTETEYINTLFSKGLMLITQQECTSGYMGEGLGRYKTKAQDWKDVSKLNEEALD
jgi:hypothetical protein